MEEHIISVVFSIIETESSNWFSGKRDKIRVWITKRKLRRELHNRIVKKYGNRDYFNALDKFITNNNVLPSLLEYCYNPNPFIGSSHYQTTEYYTNLFIEKNPNFFHSRDEIYYLLMECYKIIFSCLNPIQDENARIVLAHINEQLSYCVHKTEQSKDYLTQNSDKGRTKSNMPAFDKTGYFQYVGNTNGTYSEAKYINRYIYQRDTEKGRALLDAILEDRRILLIGDAGFGKTNESIRLLHEICTDARTSNMIPVYLPLSEYGIIYDSIEHGIVYRLKTFITGDPMLLIQDWLKAACMVIIFDGVDDIGSYEQRERFILDANDFLTRYNNNIFLFTSRFNSYYERIAIEKKYHLSMIDEISVRKILRKEEIYTDIPREYYELFSNPFFLVIGISILRKENKRHHFNRSNLFAELFHQLYDGTEHGISKVGEPTLSSYEALQVLGQFAFENFNKPAYSYLALDQKLGALIKSDKRRTISQIISSGLFHCNESNVTFAHKLLKEYCAAVYVISHFDDAQFQDRFLSNVDKDEWKEVFVFAAGAIEQRDMQDKYLDSIMKRSLPLYVDCVKSKCELVEENDISSVTDRLLRTILDSYVCIIDNNFGCIRGLFDPLYTTHDKNLRIGIRGNLSHNDSFVSYWFEIINDDEKDVLCLSQEELQEQHRSAEARGLYQTHHFVSHSTNLVLSGMTTESGRLIAIKLIYDQLKEILEHKQLIESEYLLCERIVSIKRNFKAIKEITSIGEMKRIVDKEIAEVKLRTSPNIAKIVYGRVDLIQLQSLLEYMYDLGIEYKDLILPQPDVPHEKMKSGFIWDSYSKDQKQKRIEKFLMYFDESYMQMAIANFPALCDRFAKFKDHPCKAIALVNYKDTESGDFSCPTVTYYYKAIESKTDFSPEIREVNADRADSDAIFHDIQESYLQLGREAHNAVIHGTSFSSMIISHRTGEDTPLSDAVYDALKNSIEQIFGSDL